VDKVKVGWVFGGEEHQATNPTNGTELGFEGRNFGSEVFGVIVKVLVPASSRKTGQMGVGKGGGKRKRSSTEKRGKNIRKRPQSWELNQIRAGGLVFKENGVKRLVMLRHSGLSWSKKSGTGFQREI